MSTINKPYVALRGTARGVTLTRDAEPLGSFASLVIPHADGTVTSFELTWGDVRDGGRLVEISRQNSAHERKILLREVVAP